MKTKKDIRQEELLSLINDRDFISVKELYKKLGVSQMTVRRDIYDLVDCNKVNFVNGIVMKKETPNEEKKYHVDVAKDEYLEEKDRIGKFAASLVEPGDTIAIDLGTTTVRMVKHIPENMDIVVICNALNVLNELRKKNINKIVFSGGLYRESTQIFESEEGIALINKYRITKAFMSAAGFSTKLGVTCVNMYETPYKKAIMGCADQTILLIDSSKYNKVRSSFYAEVIDFNKVITTALFKEEDHEFLLENNTEIIYT